MYKKTKIKVGCQSGRKVVTQNSESDLPLAQSVQANSKLKQAGKQNDELVTWEFLLNMQQNFFSFLVEPEKDPQFFTS